MIKPISPCPVSDTCHLELIILVLAIGPELLHMLMQSHLSLWSPQHPARSCQQLNVQPLERLHSGLQPKVDLRSAQLLAGGLEVEVVGVLNCKAATSSSAEVLSVMTGRK